MLSVRSRRTGTAGASRNGAIALYSTACSAVFAEPLTGSRPSGDDRWRGRGRHAFARRRCLSLSRYGGCGRRFRL